MGGNYEKSIYNQLMDVMARLDSVENNYKRDVTVLNDKIDELSKENDSLKKENKIYFGGLKNQATIHGRFLFSVDIYPNGVYNTNTLWGYL